ncbi:MAG: hypothetical protein WCC95_18235 [Candidatus Sulfotelmatobacter sp.]
MRKSVKKARAGLIPESDNGIFVALSLAEVNALVDQADKALDGDSNDDEHDALYSIREQLAEMSTDPYRRQ